MVQRKLGLQAVHAKPDKGLDLQEGHKSMMMRSADFKKKIKKSRSMKLDSKLPNYMKATSSSVAKKEHTQQQQQQPQVSANIKKHGSGSCNKPARTLTKSSSLKPVKSVRTLTKAPSFKPARASSTAKKKKRSEVALCADIDMQKATCSSTMKDSKFPDFLKLNPGGTEAEGTSVTKVCPYLYCSLNGHHHKPSPPLKMFLKSKRRVLKTQKNVTKSEDESMSSPVIVDADADGDMEFYVEIYAKNKVEIDDGDGQVAESISDGSPKSEIDFEEGVEEHKVEDEDADEETQMGLAREDAKMGRFCFESDSEGELEAAMDVDGTDSEGTDMEWDEVDKEAIYSIQIEDLSYLELGFSIEAEVSDVRGGVEIMSNVGSCNDDDVLQEQEVIEDEQDLQLEDGEADNGDNEFDGALDRQQEIESEAKDEVSELKSSDGALDHQQEIELEAKDDVAEFKSSDGALDHQHKIELEAKDEVSELKSSDGALDHQQEIELEAKDEVAELKSSDSLDHQQEIELEAKDEVSELKSSDGALDHLQETELEAKDEVSELKSSDGALDHQQEVELEAKDEVAELKSSDGALDHQQEIELEAKDEVSELKSSDGALDHHQETELEAQDKANPELKGGFARTQAKEALPDTNCNRKWSIGSKRAMEESEDESEFNPREPNFLPLVPDPEAEKVDLRHQMMDERKNSDEWMLDYALQQTVTKLAPARKRKVALLVEAFESVLPVPRYHQASGFAHARPIQACN